MLSFIFTIWLAAVAMLAPLAALPPNAGQQVSDIELQRFASFAKFPLGCTGAQTAANTLRVASVTETAKFKEAAKVFHACAIGPYGGGYSTVRNQSEFSAAAALLLAARYESPASEQHQDALLAKSLAAAIIDYRHVSGPHGPTTNYRPSPLITDAGRISRDADALMNALAAAHASAS